MPRRILFLCTGNYYRSRFAEEFFNHHAKAAGLDWIAESRALALERGIFNVGPISPHTTHRLQQRGIAPAQGGRPPQALCEADLLSADRVIALKKTEHRPLMNQKFSEWCDRIEYWEVHDLDASTPAEALGEIESRLLRMIQLLRDCNA